MTPEVEGLLNKARTSLQAARLLHEDGFLDFAASRAYYAMFYAAEALLLNRGLSFSSHSAVIAAFGKEFAKGGAMDARFHRYLIDAQDLRVAGDYGTEATITSAQVDEVLLRAEDMIAEAENVLS